MDYIKLVGRTGEYENYIQFSEWFMENLNLMNVLEDEEAIQGTLALDIQGSSYIATVETYSLVFANATQTEMKRLGFTVLGIEKKGGITNG